jgi:hypothetical protein
MTSDSAHATLNNVLVMRIPDGFEVVDVPTMDLYWP